jgi:hypothetical protein
VFIETISKDIDAQIGAIESNIKSLRETFNSYLSKVSEAHSKSETMEDFIKEPYIKEVFVTETCELYDKVDDIRNAILNSFNEIFEIILWSSDDVRSVLDPSYDDPN